MRQTNAGQMRLPFGKYRGMTIREVGNTREGQAYLRWAAHAWDDSSTRDEVVRYLEEHPASLASTVGRSAPKPPKPRKPRKAAKRPQPVPDESRVGRPTDFGWAAVRPSEPAVDSGLREPPFEPGVFHMGVPAPRADLRGEIGRLYAEVD
jgi:hypothetical protein